MVSLHWVLYAGCHDDRIDGHESGGRGSCEIMTVERVLDLRRSTLPDSSCATSTRSHEELSKKITICRFAFGLHAEQTLQGGTKCKLHRMKGAGPLVASPEPNAQLHCALCYHNVIGYASDIIANPRAPLHNLVYCISLGVSKFRTILLCPLVVGRWVLVQPIWPAPVCKVRREL